MTREELARHLEKHDMRLTRTRQAIAELLFADRENRHVSAEWVARALERVDEPISLATVYNTLNSFVSVGLLRQIQTGGQAVFDTNVSDHHHFLSESTGHLTDIPSEHVVLSQLPEAPDGASIKGVDIIIRID